jgi:HlyD family secretion protein
MNSPTSSKIPTPALRSVKPEEFLPPVSRWTFVGGLVLIAGVLGAIALASVVRYNVTVRAVATVRPSGGLRVVQAGVDGRVIGIEMEPNQTVTQGEVLARIDPSPLETQRGQLQTNLSQVEFQLAQIDAQLRLLDTQLAAESQSVNQSVAVARSELSRAQRDLSEQQVTAEANLLEAEAALAFAESEMQRYADLVDSGAVSQLQLEEKQAAVRTAEAQLARAQAALNPLSASVDIAREQIQQQQAQGNALLATLTRERESLVQQRLELQTQLLRDRQELEQLERDLQKTEIRATSDGVILRLNLRNPGQVVQASDVIAEITPSANALVIQAAVSPQDIDRVQIGQPAQLRVTACPYPDFGTLSGTVTAISPDVFVPESNGAIALPRTATRPEAFYDVSIQPATLALVRGDRQCPLQAGMEVDASIISREETFLRFLLRQARVLTNI